MAAKPDWYDDGQGQERWWDGRGWTGHTRPRLEASRHTAPIPTSHTKRVDLAMIAKQPATVAARQKTGFRGRTLVIAAASAAVLGILLGIGAGSAGARSVDPASAPAYVSLQSRLTSAVTERDSLKAEATSVATRAEQVSAAQVSLDARKDVLDALKAKLDKQAKALHAKALKIKAAAKNSAGGSGSTTDGADASSVSYANCDAARAAGAAPVRVGDPGYASHLDRDGDGVGCE